MESPGNQQEPQITTRRFLDAQRAARLATVDDQGRPHIVPIVFVFDGKAVYTPIDRKPKAVGPEGLRRVRNIRSNPHVQVLVDHYDDDWTSLGYVQLRGTAALLESGAEYRTAIGLLKAKYPQYRELSLEGRPLIKIIVEHVVAWGETG